jgi:hypothetical protein
MGCCDDQGNCNCGNWCFSTRSNNDIKIADWPSASDCLQSHHVTEAATSFPICHFAGETGCRFDDTEEIITPSSWEIKHPLSDTL